MERRCRQPSCPPSMVAARLGAARVRAEQSCLRPVGAARRSPPPVATVRAGHGRACPLRCPSSGPCRASRQTANILIAPPFARCHAVATLRSCRVRAATSKLARRRCQDVQEFSLFVRSSPALVQSSKPKEAARGPARAQHRGVAGAGGSLCAVPRRPWSRGAPSGSSHPLTGNRRAGGPEVRERSGSVFDALTQGVLTAEPGKAFPLAEAAAAHEQLESRTASGPLLLVP